MIIIIFLPEWHVGVRVQIWFTAWRWHVTCLWSLPPAEGQLVPPAHPVGEEGPGRFGHRQQIRAETQSLTAAARGQSTPLPASGCLKQLRWWGLKAASEQVVIMTDTMTACADM